MLKWLTRRRYESSIEKTYGEIVKQARRPELMINFHVTDNIDGRFDLLCLHMCLVLKRLKSNPELTRQYSQDLFDFMFLDMDQSLREMGVGDLSVGNRVKEMGKALLGRLQAYESVIDAEDDRLQEALIRNVYRGNIELSEYADKLANYTRQIDKKLANISINAIIEGKVTLH
jgi:cytochrome b pre-mRNA-processing protein 3